MQKMLLFYFTKGSREEVMSTFTLESKQNINIFNFQTSAFIFKILLTDTIDLEEFIELLERKRNKAELLANLIKEHKTYRGKRKFIWKGGNIFVSQGGARIEFSYKIAEQLLAVAKEIRKKLVG